MSTKLLQRELDKLKARIVQIGEIAERQLLDSMRALVEGDLELANQVIAGDRTLDRLEVEFEEECLKLLALHQPFADDLRFIVAVLKMNNDIERIGDLAVDIARRGVRLKELGSSGLPLQIDRMAMLSTEMVRNCLLALVQTDPNLAREVLERDRELDGLNQDVYDSVVANLGRDSHSAEREVLVLTVARRLERIGDHATNVAEDVIYMTSGDIVRHEK